MGDGEKPRENIEETRTFRRDETGQSDPRKPYTGVWNRRNKEGSKPRSVEKSLKKREEFEETRGEESRRREGGQVRGGRKKEELERERVRPGDNQSQESEREKRESGDRAAAETSERVSYV